MPNLAEWLTAGSTASAAGFTAFAALSARAAARIAQKSLEASSEPLLLDARAWWQDDQHASDVLHRMTRMGGWRDTPRVDLKNGRAYLPIRNVGAGIAVLNSFGIGLTSDDDPKVAIWTGSTEAIPPGETVTLAIEFGPGDRLWDIMQAPAGGPRSELVKIHEREPFTAYFQYTDLDGGRPRNVALVLDGRKAEAGSQYRVTRRRPADGWLVRASYTTEPIGANSGSE
jgi:hypothetical protein